MRITGAQGYIGTRLTQICKLKSIDVTATDIGLFKNCTINENYNDPYKVIYSDLRNFDYSILDNIDAVIHLGAISNDPLGELDDQITYDVNFESTVKLAEEAKKKGVKRFIFSSSCIMYGSSNLFSVDESSPLAPNTTYAKSKTLAENELSLLASDSFSPIMVRNGTVFGISERMRLDTVLNSFIHTIFLNNTITIKGNGEPWRPIVHIDDVCESLIGFVFADKSKIHNERYNNGNNIVNYQIFDLAKKLTKLIPNCEFTVSNLKNQDIRTYKANFDKFEKEFPKIIFSDPIDVAHQIITNISLEVKNSLIHNKNNFIRLNHIKNLINKGIIDQNLKFI